MLLKKQVDLLPVGTALQAIATGDTASMQQAASTAGADIALFDWLTRLGKRLRTRYNLEQETVFVAWELAQLVPGLELAERQAVILLILSMLVHLRYGSTRIAIRDEEGQPLFQSLANELLAEVEPSPAHSDFPAVLLAALMENLIGSGRLSTIVGSDHEFKPLIVSGRHLYFQKMLHLEDRFVQTLRRRLAVRAEEWSELAIDQALGDVLARPVCRNGESIELNREQQEAIRASLYNPVTIISGGPGTGKTTIVVSILRVLRRIGVTCEQIAPAAPTGKAANRIGETVRANCDAISQPEPADRDLMNLAEPRTLHRLLGFSPRTGRFIHHENNRLAERVVIVDEASMIDLRMMERLVRSLRDDSLFILLGDAHQLPSVDAGAVLRDLLGEDRARSSRTGQVPGIHLRHSHRMRSEDDDGRNILTVAQAIDRGTVPEFAPTRNNDAVIVERSSISNIKFQGVEFFSMEQRSAVADQFLAHWQKAIVRQRADLHELFNRNYTILDEGFDPNNQYLLGELFAHWERFRVLCVTRVSTGSDRVNAILHQHALDQRQHDLAASGLAALTGDDTMIPGEPVVMQVNDYDRMLFNGDQGLVLRVTERGRTQPMAVFRRSGGFAAFQLESLRPVLVHSYAMTVHKAQGSEFDNVALFLPESNLPINTREILYTALTRSRASVIIIGDRVVFESGIARTISRDSGIAKKLQGGLRSA